MKNIKKSSGRKQKGNILLHNWYDQEVKKHFMLVDCLCGERFVKENPQWNTWRIIPSCSNCEKGTNKITNSDQRNEKNIVDNFYNNVSLPQEIRHLANFSLSDLLDANE